MKKNKNELLQEIVNKYHAVRDAEKYLDELRSDYRAELYFENERFINTWKNSIKYSSMAKLIEEYNSNKTIAKNKMNKTLMSRWFKKQPTRIETLKKFNEFAEFAMEKIKKEEK